MRFTQSLKKNYQFGFVYNKGKSVADKYLVLYAVRNKRNPDINRLGITVSKKVGKSVVRSRVTRLIKESYRLSERYVATGFDIVVLARVGSSAASYGEINKSLLNLLKRQNLIKQPKPAVLKEGADSCKE
ncbi:ribonuclease P protein component [Anaerotignum faecicola]|nr:ribonuclease P protein component [Anaerotignum faecicola]